MLELRTIIGAYFIINGAILIVYGLLGPTIPEGMDLQTNLNTIWGCVMLFFGLVMLMAGVQDNSGAGKSDGAPKV